MNQDLFCLVSILVIVKVIFATPVIVVDKKQNGYLWGNLIALMTNIVQRGEIRDQIRKVIEKRLKPTFSHDSMSYQINESNQSWSMLIKS